VLEQPHDDVGPALRDSDLEAELRDKLTKLFGALGAQVAQSGMLEFFFRNIGD
jgi:hypothetical protein